MRVQKAAALLDHRAQWAGRPRTVHSGQAGLGQFTVGRQAYIGHFTVGRQA